MGAKARTEIIKTAIRKAADQKGPYGFTAQDVADLCEVPTSKGTVLHYFHTLDDMREVLK